MLNLVRYGYGQIWLSFTWKKFDGLGGIIGVEPFRLHYKFHGRKFSAEVVNQFEVRIQQIKSKVSIEIYGCISGALLH